MMAADERSSSKEYFSSPIRDNDILRKIRARLTDAGIDAFMLSTGDAHQSEYVSAHDTLLEYASGFTGSSASIVITQKQALLWTDGRYFLQATQELSEDWTLMRMLEPGVPELVDWLAAQPEVYIVGVDSALVSAAQARRLQTAIGPNKELRALHDNPVALVWGMLRPAAPCEPVRVHDISLAGVRYQDKVVLVQEDLKAAGADVLVVSMLDEIAWLLNLRGSDIAFNPVAVAYAAVTLSGAALFIDAAKLSDATRLHLSDVAIRPYEEVEIFLRTQATAGRKVWVDEAQLNWRLAALTGPSAVLKPSPIALRKSVKNEAELNGIREAHKRDGAALTAFLAWLDGAVKSGQSVSEHDVALKIEEFRGRMPMHRGPSFATIAGYGANGAIIHYKPKEQGSAQLGTDAMFLLDSGAQYLDGTTDVTRTLHFGQPTAQEKECYTLVLKGHIALARLVFPEGTLGSRFDSVCRQPLWAAGLDYNHGTGHGVGAFLNVHEGPQGIGFRKRDTEAGFTVGMTTSNEPGYYLEGSFGVRIETVCITAPHTFDNMHKPLKRFCELETVTLAPIQTRGLIDKTLLNAEEVTWVNAYHARVRATLEPLMQQYFPDAVPYLIDQTTAI